MILGEDCKANYDLGDRQNSDFFRRLGGEPDFQGKKVLDLGCGTGSLVIYMARQGARRSVGIDIDEHRIEYAKENLRESFSELQPICNFIAADINDIDEGDFDIITSHDTFEHLADLQGCLAGITKRLKPGGRLYVGFGPLYNSPKGDHGAFKLKIPWGHLLLPEKWLLARLNKTRPDSPVTSVQELGLNKLSLSEFKAAFSECGLEMIRFRRNCNPHPLSRLMTALGSWKPLGEYMTHAVFCVMEKRIDG